MLFLDQSAFVAKGTHRPCYIHPENHYFCVKIMLPGKEKEEHRGRDCYKHLQRRRTRWDMIPRYYGEVATNLGQSSVFDLTKDQEGEISKSLEPYLLSIESLP
jgi:hypothetical protein